MIYLFVFIFVYGILFLITSCFSKRENFAINFIFLFFTIVSLHAIWVTRGNTLYLIFPFVIGLLVYKNKMVKSFRFSVDWLYLLSITAIGILIWVIQFALHTSFSFDEIGLYHNDYAYYSNLTSILENTLLETYYYQNIFPEKAKFSMYHYFELWSNGLIGILFNLNFYHTYILILSPLFLLFTIMILLETTVIKNKSIWMLFIENYPNVDKKELRVIFLKRYQVRHFVCSYGTNAYDYFKELKYKKIYSLGATCELYEFIN